MDKLKNLYPNKITLIFQVDGDLRLPDWFRQFCKRQGIRIELIEFVDEENLERVLSKIL